MGNHLGGGDAPLQNNDEEEEQHQHHLVTTTTAAQNAATATASAPLAPVGNAQHQHPGNLTIEAAAAPAPATLWSALMARRVASPSHAAATVPAVPTRYRVLPRGTQGMWAFKQAVEATLERRGYDGQLWEALEGGYDPEEEAQAAAAAAAAEEEEEEQAALGMTRRRQQPGGVAGGGEGRGQAQDEARRRRRAALPSQLLPAILRWADLCKEVTLLKMEDVHVANGDHVYLRSAIPEDLHGYRVVGVLVVAQAHDQGWSSFPQDHGTARGSCTWGELVVELPQLETTLSRPNVVAKAEAYRNLHAVRRWQTHVLRLEGAGEEGEGRRGVEKEEGEGSRAMIGREEQATPPSSPGHSPPQQEEPAGEEEEEKAKRRREQAALMRAMRPGAILSLQLSARYPGWVHFCRHASLTVRFARDE